MRHAFSKAARVSLKTLLFIAALLAACVWYFKAADTSKAMRAELEQRLAQAATESRAKAANALKAAEPERGKLAVIAISKELLAAALKTAEGVSFTEPSTQLKLTLAGLSADFGAVFPKVKATLQGSWEGRELAFDAEGALQHELTDRGVKLRFVVLGVVPLIALPKGLKAITSAQLAKLLNERIPAFDAPLRGAWGFVPEVKPVEDFWVPVVSGKVKLRVTLPAIPEIKVNWQPVAAFFEEAGLRVLARVSTTGPLPPMPPSTPESGPAPSEAELAGQFAKWPGLRAGKSYSATVPSHLLMGTIEALGKSHTVKVDSVATEGNLMEKTGGLPFGNGFRAGLEGPDRLHVTGMLKSLEPSWRAAADGKPGGLAVAGQIEVNGDVQIHVHGNAPQVTKRVFGVKIIDVKVGGGAGSSIGAKANASSPVTAFLSYRSGEQAFALQIESPAKVFAKIDIGGVPDDLEKALKAGFDVPLPAGKDLYRFKLPPVVSEEVKVTMPADVSYPAKTVKLQIEAPDVTLTADAIEISGMVKIP